MSDLETSIDMNARKSSDRVDHEQFQSYLNLETLICFSRGTSISPNGIKAPTSPNFQKISRIFEGSYLSEFQNEGGSNLSEFWAYMLKMLTYTKNLHFRIVF